MLSVKRTQELLAALNLSEKDAEEIRDVALMLAEIAFNAWHEQSEKHR